MFVGPISHEGYDNHEGSEVGGEDMVEQRRIKFLATAGLLPK